MMEYFIHNLQCYKCHQIEISKICFLYQNKSLSKTLELDSSYKPNFSILHSPYASPTPDIPEPRALG